MTTGNRITVLLLTTIFLTAVPGAIFAAEPDAQATKAFIGDLWRYDANKGPIIGFLEEFVKVQNLSPAFEENWSEAGHTDKALALLAASAESLKAMWQKQGIDCADVRIKAYGDKDAPLTNEHGKRRTPLLTVEFPAFKGYTGTDTVLLYGHMDKQPEMLPWSEGLAPRQPVLKNGKLYGRGAADDGYALFCAMSALASLRQQNLPHARSIIIIEGEEESDSKDVTYYLNALKDSFGDVSLVVCLDSGAEDYDRIWVTNSLRGVLTGVLKVETLSEAVHSGSASGIAPSPFRVARALLSRLEDENTGKVNPEFLYTQIPAEVTEETQFTASIIGDKVHNDIPLLEGVQPMADDTAELLLNRNWRPQLSITGISGLPDNENAGNIIIPGVTLSLSLRIPPQIDAEKVTEELKALLEKDPPYKARVSFTPRSSLAGWSAPRFAPWLAKAVNDASTTFYGQKSAPMGEGGSIGFMPLFTSTYPQAQIFVTGLLGPLSNAHAPDEAMDIDMASKLTMSVSHVLAAHAARAR